MHGNNFYLEFVINDEVEYYFAPYYISGDHWFICCGSDFSLVKNFQTSLIVVFLHLRVW